MTYKTVEGHDIKVGGSYESRVGDVWEVYDITTKNEEYPIYAKMGNTGESTFNAGGFQYTGQNSDADLMRSVKAELKIEGVEPEAPKCVNGDPIIRDGFYNTTSSGKVKIVHIDTRDVEDNCFLGLICNIDYEDGSEPEWYSFNEMLSKWKEPKPAEPETPKVLHPHKLVFSKPQTKTAYGPSPEGVLHTYHFESLEAAQAAIPLFKKLNPKAVLLAIVPALGEFTVGQGLPEAE